MGKNVKMAENREMVFRHFVLSSFLFTVRRGYCGVKNDVPHVGWVAWGTSVDRRGARRFGGCERASVILCRN